MTLPHAAALPPDPPMAAARGPAADRALATVGAASGLGAVLASSCCIVPLLLGGLGAGSGVLSVLGMLTPWRLPLIVAGGLAAATAWGLWWHRSRRACPAGAPCGTPRGSWTSLALVAVATKLVVVAAVWPWIEPVLLAWIGAS